MLAGLVKNTKIEVHIKKNIALNNENINKHKIDIREYQG